MTWIHRPSSLRVARRALLAIVVAGAPACGGRSPLDVEEREPAGAPPPAPEPTSVDGLLLALTAERWPRLVAIDVDTGEETTVSPSGHVALFAEWSPRGDHVVLGSTVDGREVEVALRTLQPDGWTEPRHVFTTSVGEPSPIRWAASGRHLAFTPANDRLAVASIDERGDVVLQGALSTSPARWIDLATWSDDATSMVWKHTDPRTTGDAVLGVTHVRDERGSTVHENVLLELPEGTTMAWFDGAWLPGGGSSNPMSPDGRWVAIHVVETGGPLEGALVVADATGAEPSWIVGASEGEGDPAPGGVAWSPDASGRALVLGDPPRIVDAATRRSIDVEPMRPWAWLADGHLVGRRPGGDVVRMTFGPDLDVEEVQLARGLVDVDLAVGPAGQLLVHEQRGDGSWSVRWASTGASEDGAEVISGERFDIEHARWSPDGTLVAVYNRPDRRVVVLDASGIPAAVAEGVAPSFDWSWSRGGDALALATDDGVRVHLRSGGAFVREVVIPSTDGRSWFAWQP